MNLEQFIAKRIISKNNANVSKPALRVSIASIALGIATMIVSLAIVIGFQKGIREKVVGFGSHIIITQFNSNTSFETEAIEKNEELLDVLYAHKNVSHIQEFAVKAGIIKTDNQIEGVVFKGIGSDFDWSYFKTKIQNGNIFSVNDTVASKQVIISKKLASLLNFNVGDDLRMYFIVDEKQRGRKFQISGIYETGLEEFDKMYIIGDVYHIRKLNAWDNNQTGGLEINIKDFNKLEKTKHEIYELLSYDLLAISIKEQYPQIFDWLALQDMNVIVIIVLMIIVSAIAVVSALLILILERTAMIGTLKAMGIGNGGIRKIFIYNALYIIAVGMFWGNLVGVFICVLQKQFGFIKLSQESYYLSEVPIDLNFWHILLINIGTFVICGLIIIIPTYIINKLSPIKTMRFS